MSADGWAGDGRAPGKPDTPTEGGGGESQRPPFPDKETCPVTPLGKRGMDFWYFTADGELVMLAAGRHDKRNLKGLFGGDLEWCKTHFPAYDNAGMIRENTWSDDAVSTVLIRWCREAGLFDPAAPVRGPGVWRDGLAGLIVHCGDRLIDMETDTEEPAGVRRSGVLYPAFSPVAAPASRDNRATTEDGRKLLNALELWNFRDLADPAGKQLGPECVLGFIGPAMLGGAPQWRNHMLVRAKHGSGKTWLATMIAGALGAGAHPMQNNYTEPALRQALTGEARALILDEAESTDQHSRVRAVIEMLRHMSGGDGVRSIRGTTGGKHLAYQVTGCAYLSAILPPPLEPQDRSRMIILDLDELPTGDSAIGSSEKARAMIAWASERSAAFRARAIAGWDMFNDGAAAYRSAALAAECSMRQADQLATLLAGRDLLLHDHPADPDSAAYEVSRFAAMLEDFKIEEEAGEGEQCLTHLFTSLVDHQWRSGERRTVGQIILKAMESQGGPEREILGTMGLRIEGYNNPLQSWLLIAKRHVGLNKIFDGTRWTAGTWDTALRYLHNAKAWPTAVRFAGSPPTRALALPASWLPQRDPPTEEETRQAADDNALNDDPDHRRNT